MKRNTMRFFKILYVDYFLEIGPLQWRQLKNYENALKADHAQHLKVTNDNAERVVALIQQYNLLHIRDEVIKLF